MTTEIQKVVRDNRWKDEPIFLTQFGGGDKGLMVQVTVRSNDGALGYIQLTRSEAVRFANRLTEWAHGHAVMGDGCDD